MRGRLINTHLAFEPRAQSSIELVSVFEMFLGLTTKSAEKRRIVSNGGAGHHEIVIETDYIFCRYSKFRAIRPRGEATVTREDPLCWLRILLIFFEDVARSFDIHRLPSALHRC